VRTLLIDNYDSFTFNLAQYIAEVNGEEPIIVKNDELPFTRLMQLQFDNIVISPGPGSPQNPEDFGVCRDVIRFANVPILGVCLGFQGIAMLHGFPVAQAPEPRHGLTSLIRHDGSDLFENIPSPFHAVRYHSLCIPKLIGPDLIGTAYTDEGILMALRHSKRRLWGVQFHPESILTEYGHQLLRNFKNLTPSSRSAAARRTSPIHRPRSREAEAPVQFRKLSNRPSPESVFSALYADKTSSAWLDSSSSANGLARFSFIADTSNPADYVLRYRTEDEQLEIRQGHQVEVVRQSIFEYLRDALYDTRTMSTGLPFDFCGGFVGYFGYELKSECGGQNRYRSDFPDAYFLRVSRFIAFDHLTGDCFVVTVGNSAEDSQWIDKTVDALQRVSPAPELAVCSGDMPQEFTLDQDHREYVGNIQSALEKIRSGESYQVCLTNRIRCDFEGEPFDLYRILRRRNPAPFSAFLNGADFSVLSSSPERFLKISPSGLIEARPMKGTIRRSADPYEDVRLASALASSEKNRAENLMIVDLLRNDLGRVSKVGSVRVPALMAIESYATVHQMVSSVQAELSEKHDRIDCIKAAFPGGSMTGAPKIRTMEIIDSLESSARGIYSGALGYLSFNGAVDLSIAIRTIVVSPGKLSMGVGGGIVALSEHEEEFQEALLKGRALMDAVREYQTIRAGQRV
jgi:para-aminobenzoate synthetase